FAKLDKNGDGAISKAEAGKMPDKFFTRLDANRDGKITKQEFTSPPGKGPGKFLQKKLQRADTDGNGSLSRAELTQVTDRLFAKLDRNSNGSIERGELWAGKHRKGGPKQGAAKGKAAPR
ncbi:MAG TPA: hypothetical protein VKZ49_11070, partial [Polyangiaceae bacterium]|nr:hypothetical protein [Polyangiaceae bacterium]